MGGMARAGSLKFEIRDQVAALVLCLVALSVAGCASRPSADPGTSSDAHFKRRGPEVLVIRNERTHYFENRRPQCLAYSLAGEWDFALQKAALHTLDGRRFVGVALAPGDARSDAHALQNAIAAIRAETARDWGPEVASTVAPFPAARPRAVLLQFTEVRVTEQAVARALGPDRPKVGEVAQLPNYVLLPIPPRFIVVITVAELADAREVIRTLETTDHPQCWGPTIRERFPGLLR